MESPFEITGGKDGGSPIVSISIVNYNTSELTKNCVRSIIENVTMDGFEILVVDNCSTDEGVQTVGEMDNRVTTISLDRNCGFAKANNVAFSRAKGRYFLLLNPDTKVFEGAIEQLVAFLESHPECAAVGPRLLNPDGSLQYSCRTFPNFKTVLFSMLFLEKLFPNNKLFGRYRMTYWHHDTVREVDQPMGACLLIRSNLYREFGMLDERFFLYFEEVDLCKRLKDSGWKIFFLPSAVVLHYENQSTKQDPVRASRYYFESMVKYFRKHFGKWSGLWLKPILFVGIALRICINCLRYVVEGKDKGCDFLIRCKTFLSLIFRIHRF